MTRHDPASMPYRLLIMTGCCGVLALGIPACFDHPGNSDNATEDYGECVQILANPSFEETRMETAPPPYNTIYSWLRAKNWVSNITNWERNRNDSLDSLMRDPDLFLPPSDVPDNYMGSRTPLDGNNYAGIALGINNGTYHTESLIGSLFTSSGPRPPEGVRRRYTITAWFSTGSKSQHPVDVQLVLIDSGVGPRALVVAEGRIPATQQWVELTGSVETSSLYGRFIIYGIDKSPHSHPMSYVYVDKVSVTECIDR